MESLLILNPASGAGATGRREATIRTAVEARLGPLRTEVTRAPMEAREIAARACTSGVERILVGGGDGTASEIAAGLLASPAETRPVLGLLPLGSGWDWARSLELPRKLEAALDVIAGGRVRRVDAGELEYRDASDVPRRGYFINEASCGLSGTTVQLVGRRSKRFGPRLGFAAGAISAIAGHRPVDLAIQIDEELAYEGPVSMVVVAHGCYFGAGMRVAPGAVVDDGLFEVVLIRGLSIPRLLVNLPSLFIGRHLNHPSVSRYSARRVSIVPKDTSAPIDVDGEALGQVPLAAKVLPGALRVYGPPRRARSFDRVAT